MMKKWGLKFCLLMLLSVPFVTLAAQTHLSRVQLIKLPTYERIIFNLSEQKKYHIFSLSHPHRLVVDFDDTRLQADIKHLNVSGPVIKGVRSGWPKPGTLRLVFDVDTAIHFKNFLVNSQAQQAELIIDVYPAATNSSIAIAVPKPTPAPTFTPTASPPSKPKVVELIVARHKILPTKMTRVKKVEAPPHHTVTIVIDAGHGGKDPGTIGVRGTKEKDVVLAIALHLADLINQEPNMHALLTRNGDYFVTLRDRLRLAHKDKADLFIAIHADSFFNEQSEGVSVYALSRHGATNEAARWLAQRENTSELGGVDLAELGDKSYVLRSVLIDLAQTATIMDSLRLGTDVLKALDKVTNLHYSQVEQAPFVVLKSPDIPSVLVETGYLSNSIEEEHLREKAYRDKLALALLDGIHRYVRKANLSST